MLIQNDISRIEVKDGTPEQKDLDEEITALHGRKAWSKIEVEEHKMASQEKERLESIKSREELIAKRKKIEAITIKRIIRDTENRVVERKREEIEQIMDALRIAREDEIISTYQDLLKNKQDIKVITDNYKLKVEEIEREIDILQNELQNQKFEAKDSPSRYDAPDHVKKIKEIIRDHHRASDNQEQEAEDYAQQLESLKTKLIKHVAVDKNQEKVDYADNPELLEKMKNKCDLDAMDLLEKQYSDSLKELLKKESEMKRMTSVVNSACTSISRIMFQLDKNVSVA